MTDGLLFFSIVVPVTWQTVSCTATDGQEIVPRSSQGIIDTDVLNREPGPLVWPVSEEEKTGIEQIDRHPAG